jgi:hypothetical protein
MKEECRKILKELTDKKNIYFTKTGDHAVKKALKIVKEKGYNEILTQDQGGWITYSQFINKLGLKEVRVKTNWGIIEALEENERVLLINSMPGYTFLQDMNKIKAKFIINDIAGSIGTEQAKKGDIIIGSFGKHKPLMISKGGGFIATNEEYDIEEAEINFQELRKVLASLKTKLEKFDKINKKIKQELKKYNIIMPERQGINVIIRYSSEEEKERLINYCHKNNYEYTECPRYIRVMEKAISIEVKRC